MDAKIQQFLMDLPDNKRELTLLVRDIMLAASPKVTESIKWGQLTFSGKKSFSFIYSKPGWAYMNLGFFDAVSLSDPRGLFEGTGTRMRHIKLYTVKDIPAAQVKKWVKESLDLEK